MEAHFATVAESIADVIPEVVALVQGEVRRTWGEFDDRTARLASAFAAAGLQPGSKVAQYLYNSPEYLETYYAALKMRAVPVNVNYRYLDDELLYLLDNSESEALVFHSSLGDRVARVRDRAAGVRLFIEVDDGGVPVEGVERYEDVVAAHDPASRIERSRDDITMVYTGGTTGMPKGVMGRIGPSVEGYFVSVPQVVGLPAVSKPEEVAAVAKLLADENRTYVSMPACPLMHGTGLAIGALPTLTFGGTVVLLTGRGLDVGELWSTVEREHVNAITIVGDTFARPMLRALEDGPPRDLTSVGLILSAGAMFSEEIRAGLLEHVPAAAIVDYIAATEGGMGVSISTKGSVAATGRFLPGPEVRVLTEDGKPIEKGSGEMGLVAIAITGPLPLGYYGDVEKTARTFPEIDGVRYSIPGDWAIPEADGTITLLGRGSQCINTGGEKVFPEEVEEVLKTHASVDDALIFGIPDERFGQRIVGVVSAAPGESPDAETLKEYARTKLSSYKLPRQLVVVDVAPRAPNGKADYPTARQLFEAAAPSP